MTSARLAEIFDRACALPIEERAAFVAQECGDDAELRRQVTELLEQDAHYESAERFEDSRVFSSLERRIADEAADVLGGATTHPGRIGPYRILGKLGAGGMGIVYRAEQSNPKRVIALKVIQPGVLSGPALRRFEFEGEVLGRLHHPGIARIFEAGVAELPDGMTRLPYFAMELIEGDNLLDHASKAELDDRERLELLARVCDAVHHAHQKGIIHRDLKPGNVLVEARSQRPGHPKVLDFGVARVTDADGRSTSLRTAAGQLIGTLPYMSPEQIAGDPESLDIRSDVYSLGVILHELLCGELPIDPGETPLPEAVRRLTEEEPSRLGRRDVRFRGDIETIVAKALAKDPDRRYTSAAEFAGDLRRYLRDEPITARPTSRIYQLTKFARRNRALVIATVLVFLSLVVAWFAERHHRRVAEEAQTELAEALDAEERARIAAEAARRDETRAREEAEAARNEVAASLAAEEAARRELTRALEGSEKVTTFVKDLLASASPSGSGRDVTVREKLAGVDEKLRVFEGQPAIEAEIRVTLGETFLSLGEFEVAKAQYERAIELYTEAKGEGAGVIFSAQAGLATALLKLGQHDAGEALARGAFEGLRAAVGDFHPNTLAARSVLVAAHRDQRRPGVERELREVVEICREHLGDDHSTTLNITNNLAIELREEGRFDEAEPLFREVLEQRVSTLGERHPDTLTSRNNLGYLLNGRQRYDEALPHLESAYELGREVLGETHPNTRLFGNNLGVTYFALGRYEEVRPFFEANVAQSLADFGPDHRLTLIAKGNLAGLLRKTGEIETAIALFPEVIAGLKKLYPPRHPNVAAFEMHLGLCLRDVERYEESEPLLLGSYEVFSKAFGPENPRTRDNRRALVELYDKWGRPERANAYRDVESGGAKPDQP